MQLARPTAVFGQSSAMGLESANHHDDIDPRACELTHISIAAMAFALAFHPTGAQPAPWGAVPDLHRTLH